ncbi:MAG: hypothetical protein V4645_11330 [Pseudomonadota bacterium]
MPLALLLQLLNKRFPVTLTMDADIRHASVLVATGLIEAEFHVDSFGYQRYESAQVFAITEEGHAEIATLCGRGGASVHEEHLPWTVMPLDYLRRIGNSTFPLHTEDPSEINSVAVLEAAGMVEATLPPICRARQKLRQATVLRVTPLGRTALVPRRH